MLLLKSYLLRCFISAFVAAALLSACSLSQQAPPIHNSMPSKNTSPPPQGSWYNLTLMNTKIGYQHTSSENVEYEGEAVRRTKTDTVMNLGAT